MRRALELDPLSVSAAACVGEELLYARYYDQAIEQCRRAISLDANYWFANDVMGMAFQQTGRAGGQSYFASVSSATQSLALRRSLPGDRWRNEFPEMNKQGIALNNDTFIELMERVKSVPVPIRYVIK